MLAIDANFRLKSKDRGISDDEPLGPGWAYRVEEKAYKAEIKLEKHNVEPEVSVNCLTFFDQHWSLAQKSTCDSTFQAIEKAMMGSGEIYTSNGVGAVICSRHGLVRAQGVADIQKGEKWVVANHH